MAITALVLFGISFLLNKFGLFKEYNPDDLRSILVMVYLFTNLKYNMLENKDKDAEIQH
ncbi:hypothetical protein [uncultured Polaribacter sp.]|uniref:hypothetical protein n=1 Tax=uncultured Polaribacter sp. TaxID=174711 RepID=UPI00262BE95F|nr:hypothetical protein [uncultured Polaribacter sp.]